jgi:iron complex transport system substrate-binding protein
LKNRLIRFIALSVLCAFFLLCSCSQSSDNATRKTRKITDAAGRVVEIPLQVNRVVDLWPANHGIVLIVGGADKLVGTVAMAKKQPWFQKLYPRIKEVPVVSAASNDINIETLIGLHPDVILMSYAGGMPAWMDRAASARIPVVLMPAVSFDDIKKTILMTGEVLGPKESAAARELADYYQHNIDRVRAVTAAIPIEKRPRVLHSMQTGVLAIDGVQSLVDNWINIAGGRNAADVKGLGKLVTMEQVLKWNPDVIICGTAPNAENKQKICSDPQWSGIKAVKEGRVYVNPTGVYLWDRHSAEGALQVLWAAKLLHPESFRDLDLKKETAEFYRRFFHYQLTDGDYASILGATAP